MKYTNEESKDKFKRLSNAVKDFEERESELLSKWKIYANMTQSQIDELRKKWDEYYNNCRKTKVYDLFRKQSDAFKTGDKQTVLDISKEMTRIRDSGEFEYTKPSSIDPDEMRMRLQNYWNLKRELEGKSESDEEQAKSVFGKKEESKEFSTAKSIFS